MSRHRPKRPPVPIDVHLVVTAYSDGITRISYYCEGCRWQEFAHPEEHVELLGALQAFLHERRSDHFDHCGARPTPTNDTHPGGCQ